MREIHAVLYLTGLMEMMEKSIVSMEKLKNFRESLLKIHGFPSAHMWLGILLFQEG